MNDNPTMLKGVVRGKTIELEQESGLPEGQDVLVRVETVPSTGPTPVGWTEARRQLDELREQFKDLPPGEGLNRAFGAWADRAEEVDRFVEENYRLRLMDRTAREL